MKVDLSTPKFKKIANAALKAGFKVSNNGSLTIKEGLPPITFAVRHADFDKILTELGIEIRGVKRGKFEKVMEAAAPPLSCGYLHIDNDEATTFKQGLGRRR